MKYFMLIGVFVMGQYSSAKMCGNYNIEAPGPTPLVAPVRQVSANCQRTAAGGTVTMDQACLADNQTKEQEYQYQSGCFSLANQVQQGIIQAAAADAERQKVAAASAEAAENSAKAAAETAQKENEKGQQIYQLAAIGAGIASGYYANIAATCTPPGCQVEPGIKAAIFGAMALMAKEQSNSHGSVANAACEAAGQMSSTGSGTCGPAPEAYNPQSFPGGITGDGTPGNPTAGTIFDANGRCIGSAADCAAIVRGLPPGVNIKDGLTGLNSFATNSGKYFKVDKDGTVVTKDGKKYTPADFASEKAMIAAGMSAADAKMMAGSLNSMGAAVNAKEALAKENASDSGAFGQNGAGGKGAGVNANGGANGGKELVGSKREVASVEGLAVEFNGDMIGNARDDIFKMMNRRYKLKNSQDNFIAP